MSLVTLHWYAGWTLVLVGLLIGSVLGLFFHQENFLGGYSSFRRRLLRLGHVALVALGLFNVVFAVSLPTADPSVWRCAASPSLLLGSVAMPALCFLTAWRRRFRHGFVVPVLALVVAVVTILLGGVP